MASLTSNRPWQLPDGIDELLPDAAARVEDLRRSLLDCAEQWGYRLVIPPMLEYTDSLLLGVGEDLDLLTFKVPDQQTGRMLGLRADITPQVARIDAHSLDGEGINRFCYVGSTLHTQARSLAASRSPLQLGAELYGDASSAADLEVIDLMLSMMERAGIAIGDSLTLDLGHGEIFRSVLAQSGAAEVGLDEAIFSALQRKSRPDLEQLVTQLDPNAAKSLLAMLDLHGDSRVLDKAEALFAQQSSASEQALGKLRELVEALERRYPSLSVYVDLAELRGYGYHTGVVFSLYAQGLGEALAQGGRYDNVGRFYGHARPATGFATDLRVLVAQLDAGARLCDAIAAPAIEDVELHREIRRLRSAGEVVIVSLGGVVDSRCCRELVKEQHAWRIEPLASNGERP